MERMGMSDMIRDSQRCCPGNGVSENGSSGSANRAALENGSRAVIVTGASSGLGRAIAKSLAGEGFQVFGVGRNFGEDAWPENFHKIVMDMNRTGAFYEEIRGLVKRENIYALINNAGVGYYGLHETLNPAKIHEMVTINLEVPMVLAQMTLRSLKKNHGYMINISSVTAKQANPHGCAYGATKAGLSSFGASLFEEARKYGVHVCTIHPDMAKTNLYRNADFCQGEDADTYLLPEQVADAVRMILSGPESMTVTDVTLRPQRHQIRRKNH